MMVTAAILFRRLVPARHDDRDKLDGCSEGGGQDLASEFGSKFACHIAQGGRTQSATNQKEHGELDIVDN